MDPVPELKANDYIASKKQLLKRAAIIDCGTNTFHLLIAEYNNEEKRVLYQDKTLVKIGQGGINDKLITPEAQQRAIEALGRFRSVIDQYEITHFFSFATSAFRNATNGSVLKERIMDQHGIDINIISGITEAEYIFWGVNDAMEIPSSENSLVMDIGGGSVEFIIGQKDRILWRQSFEIGAQRLLDLYHRHDPILEDEIIRLKDYLSGKLKDLSRALMEYNPTALIGSSGTFDTLSEIYCREEGIELSATMTETPLTIDAFKNIFARLIKKNRAERMEIPGMIEMRVDMIVVASCIIDFLLDMHTFGAIRVSTYSLKEGVLSQIVDGKLLA